MKKSNASSSSKTAKREHGTPFNEMVPTTKVLFVLKVIASIVTFGFAFPDVMND